MANKEKLEADLSTDVYEDTLISANSKKISVKPLRTYYNKLKDFNYYSGPKEISDKLAEIKKNVKIVKSKMEELSGETVLDKSYLVENIESSVDNIKNYVDEALTPATKKIETLKADLEQYHKKYSSQILLRKNGEVTDSAYIPSSVLEDNNVIYEDYAMNDGFVNYLSTDGRRLTSLERKIYQEISDIQSTSSYNFYSGTVGPGYISPITSLYPVPDYGVQLPTVQPKYGVQLPTEITAIPDYGVQLPEIHVQPKYGVQLPTEITAVPDYGVQLPEIQVQPKYGVQLPTEITAIPDYGVQLPEIQVQPKYGVQLPTTEVYSAPAYGVQPVTEVYSAPAYGVQPVTELQVQPKYGVQTSISSLQVQPKYGVQTTTTKKKSK